MRKYKEKGKGKIPHLQVSYPQQTLRPKEKKHSSVKGKKKGSLKYKENIHILILSVVYPGL